MAIMKRVILLFISFAFLTTISAVAQDFTVSGTVTSQSDGETLIGVQIQQEGVQGGGNYRH